MESKLGSTGVAAADAGLGLRLRAMRLNKGLRIKDVAEIAACSESMISKVEKGTAMPSLRVLHSLAAALGTTIGALFEAPKAEGIVRRAGERPVIRLGEADHSPCVALERVAPAQTGALLEVNIHIIEPGARSDGAITHEGEELGYVLDGCLELIVENERHLLQVGDSFWFPSDQKHHYSNPGRVTARILWVNTPPTF
ncbi:cupin domain-containing protein [Pseudomonas typographi]|uniref:cupin domain-containing protein n=1 Tax=Pseudomonas typographi TaxID=2715964 RepID=UPI001931ABEE|nr:cupin domain-containing protein [Pseudomonas typographi]